MAWFEKDINLARQNLEKVSQAAVDRAGERLNEIVSNGIEQAGEELQRAINNASRELDGKVDRITQELHSQRELAKADLQALVDYSTNRLGETADARIRLAQNAIDQAGERFDAVVRNGIEQAGSAFQRALMDASREIDAKLENISREIHSQRQMTKDDIKELVDYAALRLGDAVDERIQRTRAELAGLVREKIDVFKHEIDTFFIRRQEDLARERRRLVINIGIAVIASVVMGALSLMYHRATTGRMDIFDVFRVVFISLTAGYGIYLAVRLVMRYLKMTEHRKDLVFFAMRYVGVLRPESILSYVVLLILSLIILGVLLFPDTLLQWLGSDTTLHRWLERLRRP